MPGPWKKYRKPGRFFLAFSFLFISILLQGQLFLPGDGFFFTQGYVNNTIIQYTHTFPDDTIIPPAPSSPYLHLKRNTNRFLDTLKCKALKYSLIKKIYNYVVITPDTLAKSNFNDQHEENYKEFAGITIRSISIRQLDVFGTNVNDPDLHSRKRTDNILNRSHHNTLNTIIRKNLLFSAGDTVSPLKLSDNERILRQLPYIDDARIIVVPVSANEADIVVITKDVYSLGASFSTNSFKKGQLTLYEKNFLGTGHELGADLPYNSEYSDSPGFGLHYSINNILRSFINLNSYYLKGIGEETYGFNLSRKLISSDTKYAAGISVRMMYTSEDLDTLPVPEPLKYNLQDYWLQRSFLIDRERVERIVLGIRYTNNNVFDRPYILPDSYYHLQNYRIYLASVSFSRQKFYKTRLLYSYGRTEDIPYGGLIKLTAGREFNEFNQYRERIYLGAESAIGMSAGKLGYFYGSLGSAAFLNRSQARQGLFEASLNYFSNLIPAGRSQIRNFLYFNFTRGFDRNLDEHISVSPERGFTGFRNDSIGGNRRVTLSLESVLFSPVSLSGFRFAFFTFADFALLSDMVICESSNINLTGFGAGLRIRNDNLIFNTFQVRLGIYPALPANSRISNFTITGEQRILPRGFESGPPSIITYR